VITPDGKTAYVTNFGDDTVTPINLTIDTADTPIKLVTGTPDNPIRIGHGPDGADAIAIRP